MGCLQPSGTKENIMLDDQKQSDKTSNIKNNATKWMSNMKTKVTNALSAPCPTCNMDGMNNNIVNNCRTCRGKGRIPTGYQACPSCSTKGCNGCKQSGYIWVNYEEKQNNNNQFNNPNQLPKHPPSDGKCPKCKGKGAWFLGPPGISAKSIPSGDDIDDWEEFIQSLDSACVNRHCPACDGLKSLPEIATLCNKCNGKGWWNEKDKPFDMYGEWKSQSTGYNTCDKCYGKCYINYDYKRWFYTIFDNGQIAPKRMMCPMCRGLGGIWNRGPHEITDKTFDVVDCPCCSGERYVYTYTRQCRKCYGKGWFDKTFPDSACYYDPGKKLIECTNCAGRGHVNPPWELGNPHP